MTDGLFSSVDLGTPTQAGFRLSHVEVFNWGTFDKRIWRLALNGATALLTGDIGSGKSTFVDAVTTLLLPAHRISYNKAAGADTRERSLRSYVMGHYKTERNEATGASRALPLRSHQSYSVILGVFVNDGYDETVSLAQVFHQQEKSGQPDRFFVTSSHELSIEKDFTGFGADLKDLRKRLKASGAETFNGFPEYGRIARRHLGIKSEQAMELFHQTVSMKSVGNLNEFVRSHMLEPVDASDRVRGIVEHFEDLTKAHNAVKRARDQLAALAPLVATADRYDAALERRAEAEHQRDATALFFGELRIRLRTAELAGQRAEHESLSGEGSGLQRKRQDAISDREVLIAERAVAGGDRVGELEKEAAASRAESERRRERRSAFDIRISDAGFDPVCTADEFAAVAGKARMLAAQLDIERRELDDRFVTVRGREQQIDTESAEIRTELLSLGKRANNLPQSQLDVRAQLCEDLGLDSDDLPFAGELVDVAAGREEWRGVAERVLRGFALSLLVPDDLYREVSEWVNSRRLMYRRKDGSLVGIRLVYERVPPRQVRSQPTATSGALVLADCLEVKAGEFEPYLRHQLADRADHLCADTLDEFRSARRAVTRQGQVRSGNRHEKDDRSKTDDPRTWVLGWVNERKIEALTAQLTALHEELQRVRAELATIEQRRTATTRRGNAIVGLEGFTAWLELDWQEAEDRAKAADAERERVLAGSSALAEIERRLVETQDQIAALDEKLGQINTTIARLAERIERGEEAQRRDESFVGAVTSDQLDAARAAYSRLEDRIGATPASTEDCAPIAERLTTDLQKEIERLGRELGGYSGSIYQEMNKVLNLWPELRADMSADIESRGDFRALSQRVADDDLPRFEADFKQQLHTNTIRELASFNNWLNRQADEIQLRVDRINDAMGAIDYSPGRYIRLEKERTNNQEVQNFRQELRNATNDALASDDDPYSEQRFLDVQRIIERFRGRDGHADSDKTWTLRVTDVRNWFTFSASERDRETDEEWEHYRDSDGKSGGQKEKLAYTILAASLAYQFGLEWGVTQSRDFRFAVIDEAFGRGSDASTRYALELFAKLGLQLLIVTPLQKVHVIEPYVRAIGFVDNPTGDYSRLHTLTIEEFHDLRDARA